MGVSNDHSITDGKIVVLVFSLKILKGARGIKSFNTFDHPRYVDSHFQPGDAGEGEEINRA